MKKNEYITNESPQRNEVVAALKTAKLTTAEVAAMFGWRRERAYNILNNLQRHGLISRAGTHKRVVWGRYKADPAKQKPEIRETPCLNGTMREKLTMSYMTQPARAGATDASHIRSLGF